MTTPSEPMTLIRQRAVTAIVDAMETLPDLGKLYINVLVFADANNPDSPALWDAPMEHVKEDGLITLNISQASTGHREFTDEHIVVNMRFNGVERQLFVPYGLIVGISALTASHGLIAAESLMAFMPRNAIPNAAPEQDDTPPATTTDGNVVTATFGGGRKH